MKLAFNLRAPEKTTLEGHSFTDILKYPASDYLHEQSPFFKGDDYFFEKKIERISFLKIDTEGHDFKVLKGFSKLIKNNKVDVIQFEYNKINIVTKNLLADFYVLLNSDLTDSTYKIGRIYPNGVYFKEYSPYDENFIDGNFLAVRTELKDLVDNLSCSILKK